MKISRPLVKSLVILKPDNIAEDLSTIIAAIHATGVKICGLHTRPLHNPSLANALYALMLELSSENVEQMTKCHEQMSRNAASFEGRGIYQLASRSNAS